MFGHILRLDAGRQQRVGTNPLQLLLSAKAYKEAKKRERRLNASVYNPAPFAPSIVRTSLYPDYFRGTDLRTLYWKVKNFDGLHGLSKLYIDEQNNVIFEFDKDIDPEVAVKLSDVLANFNHSELKDPRVSGNKIVYRFNTNIYSYEEAGEV